MISKKDYEKAKKVIEQYEQEQLNIPVVMWRCNRKLRMKDGEICFVNGKEYEQINEKPLELKDEQGYEHVVGDKWEKWFSNAT